MEDSPSPNAKKRSNTFKASDLLLGLSGPLLTLGLPQLHYQDFVPEVLATRSRAETATCEFIHRSKLFSSTSEQLEHIKFVLFCVSAVTRRREMEEEIDKHERERISTARPGEEARLQATVVTGHHRIGSLMSQVEKKT